MKDRVVDAARPAPVIDYSQRMSGAGRLIVLAFALVGVAGGFALIQRERAEPFVLGLLGLLAVIGVFTLLAAAIGLIRFGSRAHGGDLSKVCLDTMTEGVLITDRDARIVYANQAYARLVGAESERDVRGVERVFSGEPSGAEAIYRMAQAIREGQPAEEEVRLLAPLSPVTGEGARWYRIAARPLSPPGAQRPLTAWTVADISRERAEQELIFQDLQHAIDYLDHAPAGFFSAEPDGRIVYMNATLAQWLGVDIARFEVGKLSLADIVRGDGIALLDGNSLRRAAQPDRDHRPRFRQEKRPEPPCPASPSHLDRGRRRSRGDADAGSQPQPRRGRFRSPAGG